MAARLARSAGAARAALRCALAAALACALVPLSGLSATAASYDTTDEDALRHGTISISCEDADEDGVIYLEVGESVVVEVSPYTHLQWLGCLKYGCPDLCEEQHADDPYSTGCFVKGFGCKCDGNKVARSVELTCTLSASSVVEVGEVEVDEKWTNSDNTSFSDLTRPVTKDATVTVTATAAGTTTLTVSAATDEDAYALALDHDSTLITLWHPAEVVYTIVVADGSSEEGDGSDEEAGETLTLNDEGYYEIGSEEELALFAEVVNGSEDGSTAADPDANGILTCDIELESGELPAIGATSATAFCGVLDGDGHTISNITSFESASASRQGLVVHLDGGTLRDLTLAGSVEDIASPTGAFVCYLHAGTVEGCVNEVDLSGSVRLAGVVCYVGASSSDEQISITGCANNAAITSSYASGGLSGSSATASGTAGIVGSVQRGCVSVSECENTGAVSAAGNVGGIVGMTCGAHSGYVTLAVEYSVNRGAVTLAGADHAAGGILGATLSCDEADIAHCYDTGDVTVSAEAAAAAAEEGAVYAGGIVGYSGEGTTAQAAVLVENAFGTGAVGAEADDADAQEADGVYAGALAGGADSDAHLAGLDNCYWLEGAAAGALGEGFELRDASGATCIDAEALAALAESLDVEGAGVWSDGVLSGHPLLYWEPEEVCEMHVFTEEWTWDESMDYATSELTLTCSVCGTVVSVGIMNTWETTAATCTDDAYTVYSAAFSYEGVDYSASLTVVDEGSATGHSWSVSGWTWADDYSSATVSLLCESCGALAEVEGVVVSEVVSVPTCTADGELAYTASATLDGVEFSDAVALATAATGHSWSVSGWTWADDCSSATAVFTCAACGASAEVAGSVVRTAGASGATYTVTASFGDATGTDERFVAYSATRIGGATRYETAADTALAAFDAADVVVLASGADFADALAAAPLAGALEAPVLLTKPGELSAAAASAVEQLGATTVVVVGGEAAVSADVVDALYAIAGVEDVERIAGANRYETAEAVLAWGLSAGEDGGSVWGGTAIVASGAVFADALSASPVAYAYCYPVLLADATGALRDSTLEALAGAGVGSAVVAGGEDAVGAQAYEQIEELLGEEGVVRLGGQTRYETSAAVAAWAVESGLLGWDGVCLASGAAFPDALSGSALAGSDAAVLLLVGEGRTDAAAEALADAAEEVERVFVLGGTNAVAEGTVATLLDALGWQLE